MTVRRSQLLRAAFEGTIYALGAFALGSCSAQEAVVPSDWRADCVGRMQLSLPRTAGFPFTPEKRFKTAFSITKPRDSMPFVFADGSPGGYTDLYYRSHLMISGPLAAEQLNSLLDAHGTSHRAQAIKNYGDRTAPDLTKYTMARIAVGVDGASAWQFYGRHFDLAVRYGDHLLAGMFESETTSLQESKDSIAAFVRSIRSRRIFDLPPQIGVCLPYTFIEDDGMQGRSIGVTYLLQDHPDVTVWLEDSTPPALSKEHDSSNSTAEYKTEFFWNQRYQSRKSYRSAWSGGTKSVKLDGRSGVSSFVELTRRDDTIDYGYLAVVRGDPEAKQDAPDLMLYVVRDAQNAIANGKQPLDKDSFIKMAEAIAASVKHRSVQ